MLSHSGTIATGIVTGYCGDVTIRTDYVLKTDANGIQIKALIFFFSCLLSWLQAGNRKLKFQSSLFYPKTSPQWLCYLNSHTYISYHIMMFVKIYWKVNSFESCAVLLSSESSVAFIFHSLTFWSKGELLFVHLERNLSVFCLIISLYWCQCWSEGWTTTSVQIDNVYLNN